MVETGLTGCFRGLWGCVVVIFFVILAFILLGMLV